MNYNEWLEIIELVRTSNRNITYLEKMQNTDNNENINEMLRPKLVNLITEKVKNSIKKIVKNLTEIFKNSNTLELTINNFEKDIQYILQICNLKQIDINTRNELIAAIINEKNTVYDILIKKSIEIDRTGMYKTIIERKKNTQR